MRALLARVARAIRQDCLIAPAGRDDVRIVVALSGGSDSVALSWILRALAPDRGITLAGLIHVNHQLRGAASDGDEAFCRDLAVRMSLPIKVTSVDVAARAREARTSIEVAAREVRYAFYERAASELRATHIATGHTLDDQAETVLLRLLRGAGSRGVSGIRARRGNLVRPLLSVRRHELRAYLHARGEAWREDDSNQDISIPRNHVRHHLMPVIEQIAPGGVKALGRFASLAQADEAWLTEEAIKSGAALVSYVKGGTGGVTIDVDADGLSLLSPAIARRVLRSVAADVAPARSLSARHLEAVWELAGTDKSAGQLDLPGLTVRKQTGKLTFTADTSDPRTRAVVSVWPIRPLTVPGAVEAPEGSLQIVSRRSSGSADEWTTLGSLGAGVQADSVRLPLSVRNWRPGDRFRPLGAPGRRKLQDLFVDRKVPRSQRDRVAVIVDADDRIVWVAGLAVAHDCRVTAPEAGVLILELRELREQRTTQ